MTMVGEEEIKRINEIGEAAQIEDDEHCMRGK